MERTGHRSTDGVRVYKRSSTEQEQVVSKVLNREIRKSTLLPPSAFSSSEKENEPPTPKALKSQSDTQQQVGFNITPSSTNPSPLPSSLSLVQCHGITINYNFSTK